MFMISSFIMCLFFQIQVSMLNEEISLNGDDPLHFQVILFTLYRNFLDLC